MTRSEVLNFIATIHGWLSSHEGYFLYESAKKVKKSGVIVEIGSWMGKSTICLASGSKRGNAVKVYAIDPHKGEFSKGDGIGKKAPTFAFFQQNLKKAEVTGNVRPIVATSEEAAKKWKGQIDLLFIDGLHDYKNTKLDFSLWSPLLAKRGVIAFHDAFCGHTGPEKVVLESILLNNAWSNIGIVGSIIFARKQKAATLLQYLDLYRHRIFIPLAYLLNKSALPKAIKFFLIHRMIKLFLLNELTWKLQFEK